MSVWAVTMVKDEADVIVHNLEHLAGEGVDGIIVADNMSTDGTLDLLHEFKSGGDIPFVITNDDDVAYYQSAKMTALANMAAQLYGAEWIIPFDADEIWYNPTGEPIRTFFESVPLGVNVIECSLHNHICTGMDDELELDPFKRICFVDPEVNKFPKVAFRYTNGVVVKQGNHDVEMPNADKRTSGLIARHFPIRSLEHFERKARNGGRAYAATNMPLDEGDHWRRWGALVESDDLEGLKRIYDAKFYRKEPKGLVYDPAPLSYR